MTPEVVIYRYLEVLQREPVDVAALTRIICADADLLGRWLTVLRVPADPDGLRQKLTELQPSILRVLARAEAQAMLFDFGAVRLSIHRWESALRGAFLAEALARDIQPATAAGSAFSANRIRSLVLLATSGVALEHDSRLRELIDLRGAAPEELADADPVHQILAIVDESEAPETAAELAHRLLGISADRFAALVNAAEDACQRLLKVAGLQDEGSISWGERIAQEEQIATLAHLFEQPGPESLFDRHRLAVRGLFRSEPSLLLRGDDGIFRLQPDGDVRVLPGSTTSGIARACREGVAINLAADADGSIADRLILRRLDADEALVLPLIDGRGSGQTGVSASGGACRGALVFPINDDPDPETLMRAYAQMLGRVNDPGQHGPGQEALARLENYRQRELARLRELVHEANNPLSIVNNYLHILELRLADDTGMREQLATMGRELRRASAIFQQVKDLPPVEAETPEEVLPKNLPIDLGALVRRTVELHRGYADASGVEIELGPVPTDLQVATDEDLLAQVLTNLLRNAIEACSASDLVTVSIAPEVYRNGAKGVEIDIHDSGPGIEPTVLARLFEPKASTKGPEHSGLGLSIVYRLVNVLGGSIDVRSSAASGTSFRIFLGGAPDGHD